MKDTFCLGSLHYRAYDYSQPSLTATPGVPRTRLLVVEQLAESPCLFAVPHQLIRILLRDQRHHLNTVSNAIRDFAIDSLQTFETGGRTNLIMHMAGEHGDGGQAASFSRGRIYPGGMYETALAMIKEDAERGVDRVAV